MNEIFPDFATTLKIARETPVAIKPLADEFNRRMSTVVSSMDMHSWKELYAWLEESNKSVVANIIRESRKTLRHWEAESIQLGKLANHQIQLFERVKLRLVGDTTGLDFILETILKIPPTYVKKVKAELLQ